MDDRVVKDILFGDMIYRNGSERDNKRYVEKEDLHRYIYLEEGANRQV